MEEEPRHVAHSGLTSADAAARLIRYGPNSVATKRHLQPIVAFVSKFNSPLLWIIITAALVSLFIGQRTNAFILLFMVLLSVVLDFVNSYRSQSAVDKLISKVVTTATVTRDGREIEVPLAEVVPGDLVSLSSGDAVPADGVIIASKDLFINQSALTGESVPAEKRHRLPPTIREGEVLNPNDADAAMMGTSVVTGFATMVVASTGTSTAFGRIAERLSSAEPPTDFDRSIRQFSVFLMRVTLVMTSVVFIATLLNPFSHQGFFNALIFAIAIAIGLTPELLPVIITVSLSRGAVAMSKKGVIVKRLPAIQNFGRMDVLCTDKTGTLTENRITVVQYVTPFGEASDDVLKTAYMSSIFHSGVQNPLDDAIKHYRSWDLAGVSKVDEIPFDFERRRESIAVATGRGVRLITKGAPEAMFAVCSAYRGRGGDAVPFDRKTNAGVAQRFDTLSREGFKVLGIATKDITGSHPPFEKDIEQELVFEGFLAFLDPPKTTAKKAIDDLERHGIEVKILTGDTAVLTGKICRDLDITVKGVVTGDALATMDDAAWRKTVVASTIFARIDPEQKERIIRELQKAGKVVGYLGDGINDAPALKAADVGVSVSNAVDVAKETADIILLHQSLRVLRDGVIDGRKTFQNALKYIEMGLSSNFGNMFSMMAVSSFLPFLPMLPTQVLLNNFLYDSSQLTLSTDSVDGDDVVKPTVWDMKFVRRFMLIFGPVSSLFDFATFGLMWAFFSASPAKFQTGWFIESIATQVLVIYVIRTKKVPFAQSKPGRLVLVNTIIVVAVAWLLPFLPIGRLFGLSPLPPFILAVLLGYVGVYLFLVEGVKRWFYRRLRPVRVVA